MESPFDKLRVTPYLNRLNMTPFNLYYWILQSLLFFRMTNQLCHSERNIEDVKRKNLLKLETQNLDK